MIKVSSIVQNILHRSGWHLQRHNDLVDHPAFVENVLGHRMYQNVNDPIINYTGMAGEIASVANRLDDGELKFMVGFVQPGHTVVDIGANIGIYTLVLAKLVGSAGRVIAFEPGPASSLLLKLNTLINGYKHVTVEEKAVSSATGSESLFICPSGESDNQVSRGPVEFLEKREATPIQAVSLDDYLGDTKVDYIKMDIQGGEFTALQGMRSLLQRNQAIALTIEYAPYLPLWAGVERKDFFGFVRSLGFKIYDLKSGSPVLVGDEDLVRSYPNDTYKSQGSGRMTTLLLQR